MPLVQNTAKRRLKAGKIALGFSVHHLRTVAAPLIAAAGGHDHLFIDMEHGAFTMQEATQLCIAALPTGVTPTVRVCAGALDEATRLLDNGALGIVVPHVDTVAQAETIARTLRYPPEGKRSWGGPPAVYGYLPPAMPEAQAAINAEILIVAMIERPEGVANAEGIAAVEGIDVLHVGSSDLTSEMGIAGQTSHPKLIDAYARVGAACQRHGKVLGMGGVSKDDDCARYIGMGARFITSGSDHGFMVAGSMERAKFLRNCKVGVPG